MTSPPEPIEVECPGCGRVYEDWYRPSVNLNVERSYASETEVQQLLKESTTATCPGCGKVVEIEALVVDGNVWRVG